MNTLPSSVPASYTHPLSAYTNISMSGECPPHPSCANVTLWDDCISPIADILFPHPLTIDIYKLFLHLIVALLLLVIGCLLMPHDIEEDEALIRHDWIEIPVFWHDGMGNLNVNLDDLDDSDDLFDSDVKFGSGWGIDIDSDMDWEDLIRLLDGEGDSDSDEEDDEAEVDEFIHVTITPDEDEAGMTLDAVDILLVD